MSELALFRYDSETQGFYAAFNRRVGELHQLDEIYLQLPHNADSQHDGNYDDATISKCIDILAKFYTDEDFSIMHIIGSSLVSYVDIKEATVKFLDDDGVERTANTHVLHSSDGDVFLLVDVSAVHRYYTGNKAWVVDKDLNSRFTDFERIDIYKKAGDKVY